MKLGISAMLYILNPYLETFQGDFQNDSDTTTNSIIKDFLKTFVRSFAFGMEDSNKKTAWNIK
jgi:hypothetical protein